MASENRHSYVQFYPSDWLAGMAFTPPMMEWLYLQICLYNWDKRAAMPAGEIALRLARHPGWEADLAGLVDAGKVQRTQGGGVFVRRAIVEAERAYTLWQKKSKGGRNSQRVQAQAQQSSETDPDTLSSNENENENETSPKGEGAGARVGDLVFSVEPGTMAAFRQHRMRLKAPLTPHAEDLIVKKLERFFADHGNDPTEVLNQSMERGWKGVFELKGETHGQRTDDSGSGLFGACVDDARSGATRARPHR